MGACQSQTSSSDLTNQEILLKKEDPSQPPDSLEINHTEDRILFKKFGNNFRSGYRTKVKCICHIPERNLLIVASNDDIPNEGQNLISIYNIIGNFNLVARRKSEGEISVVTYSKELKRIILGGDFVQIWSLKNFQVEVQSKKLDYNAGHIVYVPSSDIIVTGEGNFIGVYDRNLACLFRLQLPEKNMKPFRVTEIISVSKDLLLCVGLNKTAVLVNLKRKAVRECDKIFIPRTSCVAMIEETPKKVFTCLMADLRRNEWKLAQFTVNEEREELVVEKMAKQLPLFRLAQLENHSSYFIAIQDNKWTWSPFLLKIRKDKVEVLSMISEAFIPYMLSRFTLLKDESSIVVFSMHSGTVCLCRIEFVKSQNQRISYLRKSHFDKRKFVSI